MSHLQEEMTHAQRRIEAERESPGLAQSSRPWNKLDQETEKRQEALAVAEHEKQEQQQRLPRRTW